MSDEKPGIKPDKWLKHQAIYTETRLKLQEATSENQAKLKAAKADGVHIDALKMVAKLNAKDPAEAAVFIRAVLEGALIQQCAFMTQGDMLNGGSIADMLKVPEPTERAREKFRESEALQVGYDEGLKGGSADNLAAMFGAGTAELAAAIRGFRRGQEFMKAHKPEGVTPVSGGRGRRGGRKASGTTEPEAPPDEEFVPIEPSTDDPDEGAEGEAAAPPPIDMIKVQSMTKAEMAELWNAQPGVQKVKTFESRDVGIMRLSQAYANQQNQGAYSS